MDETQKLKKQPSGNIYFGWWVVAACLLVIAIRAGVGTQTLGFIIRPMQAEMGWSVTIIAGCITAQHVVASLIGPLVGRLLDKFGGRLVVTFGAIFDGITLLLMSMVTEIWQFVLVMAVLGGIAEACVGNGLIMPFISKWFVKRRGLALGIASSGANLGGILISPLVVVLTGFYGWRDAWAVVGLIPVLIVAPIAFFVLRANPEAVGLRPDGVSKNHVTKVDEICFTLREALRTPAFWILMLVWNLVDLAMKGAMLNKVPYAIEMGFTPAAAAGIITVYGISAIFGKLIIGWAADRLPDRLIGIGLALMQAAGLYVFIGSHDLWRLIWTYGIVSGFSSGGLIALMPIILADYFGRKHLGAINGAALPVLLVSNLVGPLVGAMSDDFMGSYSYGFMVYAACAFAGAVVLIFLRRPVHPESRMANSSRLIVETE